MLTDEQIEERNDKLLDMLTPLKGVAGGSAYKFSVVIPSDESDIPCDFIFNTDFSWYASKFEVHGRLRQKIEQPFNPLRFITGKETTISREHDVLKAKFYRESRYKTPNNIEDPLVEIMVNAVTPTLFRQGRWESLIPTAVDLTIKAVKDFNEGLKQSQQLAKQAIYAPVDFCQ